jgi:ABC-2 type transport system permease protein
MRDLRITLTQARVAIAAGTRNSNALIFGIALPIFLLVLFNEVFVHGNNRTTHLGHQLIDTTAYYTAGLVAYAIMLQTFSTLAIIITTQRETGQLKRLRGTPMPSWTFIAAYMLRSIAYVVVMVVALFLVGVLAFGVHLHTAELVGLIVYVALGTSAMAALGLAITRVCATAESASTVGPFTAVILSFISGVFIPIAALPVWLATIGKVFPLAHLASGLQRGLVIGNTGTGLTAADVGILAAWGAFGLVVAATTFRWEPVARGG